MMKFVLVLMLCWCSGVLMNTNTSTPRTEPVDCDSYCPFEEKCLTPDMYCNNKTDCKLVNYDEVQGACNLYDQVKGDKWPDAPVKKAQPEEVWEDLFHLSNSRHLLMVLEDRVLLINWNESLSYGIMMRLDLEMHKFEVKTFAIDFEYSGSLFLVHNPLHKYVFLIDTEGFVRTFYHSNQTNASDVSIVPGENISVVGHSVRIGAVALDWKEDILVFYNQLTHCIESTKLSHLGQLYKLTCLSVLCPPVRNLVVDVRMQRVLYHANQSVQSTSLLGYNSMPVNFSLPNATNLQNVAFDYDEKDPVVYFHDADKDVLSRVFINDSKPLVKKLLKTNLIAGDKFFACKNKICNYYKPETEQIFFYNAQAKPKGELLSVSNYVPNNNTVLVLAHIETGYELPEVERSCEPKQCQYICSDQEGGEDKCDCPYGHNVTSEGECPKPAKVDDTDKLPDDQVNPATKKAVSPVGSTFLRIAMWTVASLSVIFVIVLSCVFIHFGRRQRRQRQGVPALRTEPEQIELPTVADIVMQRANAQRVFQSVV